MLLQNIGSKMNHVSTSMRVVLTILFVTSIVNYNLLTYNFFYKRRQIINTTWYGQDSVLNVYGSKCYEITKHKCSVNSKEIFYLNGPTRHSIDRCNTVIVNRIG